MRDKTGCIEEHRGNSTVIDTEANSEGSLSWQKLYNSIIIICPQKLNDVTYPEVKSKEMMLSRSLERVTHTAIRFGMSITKTQIIQMVHTLSMITVVLFISRKGKVVGDHN